MNVIGKKDYIIILILMALSGLALLPAYLRKPAPAHTAYIIHNGEVSVRELSQDGVFSPPGAQGVVFEIKDGAVRFQKSDCKDQICVRCGWLSKDGESAACVPRKTAVRVSGGEREVDAITR